MGVPPLGKPLGGLYEERLIRGITEVLRKKLAYLRGGLYAEKYGTVLKIWGH